MVRKLFFAVVLVGASLVVPVSHSEAMWCEPEEQVTNPCDKVCGEEDGEETVCNCPCWTDRRVKQTTCDLWDGYFGCWYF